MAQSLTRKLYLKPGQRASVLNAPAGYVDRLRPLPEKVELLTKPSGKFDFVQLFVKNKEELDRLGPAAIHAVKPDGLLWISYPKKSSKVASDLSRDEGWQVTDAAGLEGVALVSIDDVWSAVRLRPRERVGKPMK